MYEQELLLRSLVNDKAAFRLLKMMLHLVAKYEDRWLRFGQDELIYAAEREKNANLNAFVLRFNGLCELICNSVIDHDLMGASDRYLKSTLEEFKKELLDLKKIDDKTIQLIYKVLLDNASNPYKDTITLMDLDKHSASHILDISSYFQQMFSYMFGIYPFNLFSSSDLIQIGLTVNPDVLGNKLSLLDDGSYIKFMAFSKGLLGFTGHSMLIKKTGSHFSFFDPNYGEKYDLNLSELCAQINSAMGRYSLNHMAFLDGKAFLKNVCSANQTHQTENESVPKTTAGLTDDNQISTFLLSEIQKFIDQGTTSDESLLQAMNTIRVGIEGIVQQKQTDNELIPLESIRYIRDKKLPELNTLDNIRFDTIASRWIKMIRNEKYNVSYSSNKHDFISTVKIEQRESGPSLEELDLFLSTRVTKEIISIKNVYDLRVALVVLNPKYPKTWAVVLNKIPGIIKTIRDVHILLTKFPPDYIPPNYTNEKSSILYNYLKDSLPNMIRSAFDFEAVLSCLEPEQRDEIFELTKEKLPGMITSIGELADVLKHLSPEQRLFIFDAVKDKLPAMISKGNDTVYDFQLALSYLLSEQEPIIIKAMMTKLPTMQLEDISTFNSLPCLLQADEANIFRSSMLHQLPNAMKNEQSCVTPSVTTEQFISAFTKLKETASARESLCYLIDKSDILSKVINSEQCEVIFNGIAANLQEVIISAEDFNLKFREMSPISRAYVFEAMKDKLPDLVKSVGDLGTIIEYLTQDQCAYFYSNRAMQQFLEEPFKNCLAEQDAKDFATALFTNDSALIKTQFDHIIDKLQNQSWSMFDFFSAKKPIDNFIDALKSMEPTIFWMKKINAALQLGLEEEVKDPIYQFSSTSGTAYKSYASDTEVTNSLKKYIDQSSLSNLGVMKRF